MVEGKKSRLREVAKEFNVGINTIVQFLEKKGVHIESNPNSRIDEDVYVVLFKEYATDIHLKKESEKININKTPVKPKAVTIEQVSDHSADDEQEIRITDFTIQKVEETSTDSNDEILRSIPKKELKVVGKIDLEKPKKNKKTTSTTSTPKPNYNTDIEDKTEHVLENGKEKLPLEPEEIKTEIPVTQGPVVVGKIDLSRGSKKGKQEKNTTNKTEKPQLNDTTITGAADEPVEAIVTPTISDKEQEEIVQDNIQGRESFIPSKIEKLSGPKVLGKIELPEEKKKKTAENTTSDDDSADNKKKRKRRKRINKEKAELVELQEDNPLAKGHRAELQKKKQETNGDQKKRRTAAQLQKKRVIVKHEVNEADVARQIKDTLARLTVKNKSKAAKHRREKREAANERYLHETEEKLAATNILKVTEFVSVNDLSTMMKVPVTEIISTCMNMGLFVSINQRLDAETMALVVDEFGYKIEFVSAEVLDAINEQDEDNEADLVPRPPIVTVMGHVDHGKTSLLDRIRKSNIIAGEAGGITQHIGAYSVELSNGRLITFLDTPGHEAFTAMRARGARLTDVVIITIAADDSVMPQTREAINHAQAAGVPIVFAINKIDKPNANPDKIKQELAGMNIIVEDWGGTYQSQEISAKTGLNVEALLEKVLVESDLKELKANPKRRALGTVIESQLDKGRGYVSTVLVQNGTLNIGDVVLAGTSYGRVKAMFNERGQRIQKVGPATPIQILGLNGAPQAGDRFNVMNTDREAKEIAMKREHLEREQSVRTQKHITLDEIGRRRAIGNFKELKLVVKGDVDGTVEALSGSLLELTNDEVEVMVIHKGVGQISESDVLLAAASNAVIIGFQVRPSVAARKIAEEEDIDIRLYSIIYDAINEVRDAIRGMLAPEIKEQIVGSAEIIDVFKITKVGSVAGCIVREGKIKRNNKVRVIRDGIVVYDGELGSLKRFKDDVKEVTSGFECGMNVDKFNDIKAGDFIEAYEEVEVKRKI